MLKWNERCHIDIETEYTSFHGTITVKINSNGINNVGIVTVKEDFTWYQEEAPFWGKTLVGLILQINKELYNLFPNEELLWVGFNENRGFEKRVKLNKLPQEETKKYFQENKNNCILDY